MKNKLDDKALITMVRSAGLCYLLIIVAGLSSSLFVRLPMIDFTDPALTATNLSEQDMLFRLGIVGDLIMVIADVVIAVLFFYILKHVNLFLAAVAAVFRLIQASILGTNIIHLISPLILLEQSKGTLSPTIMDNILFHLKTFDQGYLISGIFFSINCFVMGILLYRSRIFPNLFGMLLLLAGIGYMVNSMSHIIFTSFIPTSEILMFLFAVVSEVGCCLYLIFIPRKRVKSRLQSA